MQNISIEYALNIKNTFLVYMEGKINITLSIGLDYHYSSSLTVN